MNRAELAQAMSRSGLASALTEVQKILLNHIMGKVGGNLVEQEPQSLQAEDQQLLAGAGPAAAATAVHHAIQSCRSKNLFSDQHFNGSYVYNMELIRNDSGYSTFSSSLREFLLPRQAYVNFDMMVDPRHQVDHECGYPKAITPAMYRYLYDRDDVAQRVVNLFPDESWATEASVYESDDEQVTTQFESDWNELCLDQDAMQVLYRMDKLCGIGHYGSLLIGLDDGRPLDEPIQEPELLAGVKHSIGKTKRKVIYLRPFDEYLSFVSVYETDVNSPRYGLPILYNLVFVDMTIDAGGAAVGTRATKTVHWTRVVHMADNILSSRVFGVPRMQPVFNRLLDLRKVKGSSSEMFWKGGFPGIAFEVDPSIIADDLEFDEEKFKAEVEAYTSGLQRTLKLIGIKANSLETQVASPADHVTMQLTAIACHYGVPLRVFLGSEEGRLASSTDVGNWNKRLGRRNRTFLEPSCFRNFIDRLIAIGVMTSPKQYFVTWPDLNTPTDEDRANLSLKWTQALSQYVATGMIHLIQPLDYLTLILGLKPSDAIRITKDAESGGGWGKLKAVDPAQGAGVNGVRTAPANKKESGTAKSRPTKRDTGTKKVEGKTS